MNDSTWLQLDDTGYLEVGSDSGIVRLSTDNIDKSHETVKDIISDVDDIQTVEGVIRYFDFKSHKLHKVNCRIKLKYFDDIIHL